MSNQYRKYNFNNQSKSGNEVILIVKPSKNALINIKRVIKRVFKSHKPFVAIISELNPKIRGWVNYYRISSHSRKSFGMITNYIYQVWRKWAIKHHPKHSVKWITNKYIFSDSERRWKIGVSKSRHNKILDPTIVKIIKLRPLKTGINPYTNKEYYLRNPRISIINEYREKIYKLHKHKCYVCGELLLPDEQVDFHHLTPKSEGGTYSKRNIVPVHKTCHDTITYARKDK
jgi:RNA-directed DNA polymerase